MAKNAVLLYGINSVHERLRCNPASIRRIFLDESFSNKAIETLIRKHKISCQRVSAKRLKRIKPAKGLQKVVATAEEFQYASLDCVLDSPAGKSRTILFLDNINDPQNIGVIIRTLACFGGFALVLTRDYTCGVNDTVIHVASGGENYLPIARVKNLKKAIGVAHDKGYTIAGSIPSEDAEDIRKIEFPFPLGVVLGSEGEGIRKAIRNLLDMRVVIPMEGAGLSLNVNNACAIFCYNIILQRGGSCAR